MRFLIVGCLWPLDRSSNDNKKIDQNRSIQNHEDDCPNIVNPFTKNLWIIWLSSSTTYQRMGRSVCILNDCLEGNLWKMSDGSMLCKNWYSFFGISSFNWLRYIRPQFDNWQYDDLSVKGSKSWFDPSNFSKRWAILI